MEKPTPEQVAKLPLWAQKYINCIEGERMVAIRALNEHIDKQTKSKIYYDETLCTGEEVGPSSKRFYIQSEGVEVECAGVHLNVHCWQKSSHESGIELQWSAADGSGELIACIPRSFMSLTLTSARHMRLLNDPVRLKQFKNRMDALAKKNKDEWGVRVNITDKGYHVEVFETAENHTFTEGYGPSLPEAIEEAEADIPEQLAQWGYKE